MRKLDRFSSSLLLAVVLTASGLTACSGAVSSMWVAPGGATGSSRLDEIDPASRLLLESALEIKSDGSEASLLASLPEIPKVEAPEIERFVQFYSYGPGKYTIEEGMERRSAYLSQLSKIFAEYGLPRELVNLPLLESRYLADARSPKGAVGLWQFMKETARHYGLVVSYNFDERKDVERSSRAAATHLRDLYDIFGDWHLAIAAYNGGAGRIQGAVKSAGSRDFFELARRGLLPRETQDYVPKFLAIARVVDKADLGRKPAELGKLG